MVNTSRLLGNKKKHTPESPLIKTLENYIQMPTIQFYDLLIDKSKRVGLIEIFYMTSSFQNFDNLSEKQKAIFVRETIEPETFSLLNSIKRLI